MTTRQPSVPAEWTGRARLLRQQVEADAAVLKAAQERLFAGVTRHLARRGLKGLRREIVEGAARDWGCLPDRWCVARGGGLVGRGNLELTGAWVVSARYADRRWTDGGAEVGVGVACFHFSAGLTPIGPGRWRTFAGCTPIVVAECSLHALARWLERNPDRDRAHEGLLRDLAALVPTDPAADAVGRWACASGEWRGERGPVRVNAGAAQVVRLVRSYLHADDRHDTDALPDAPPLPLRQGEPAHAA